MILNINKSNEKVSDLLKKAYNISRSTKKNNNPSEKTNHTNVSSMKTNNLLEKILEPLRVTAHKDSYWK